MEGFRKRLRDLLETLDRLGTWLPQLALRLLLAKEFWDSGLEKFHGQNWFADIQDSFPFPLNLVSPDISWTLSTWFELIGPVALVLGLGTRFFSASLSILTLVAIYAVHAGHGYTISEGGWKLPLIYLVLFLPLLLSGPGKLSLDHWLRNRHLKSERRLWS
ncbi:MAG TPA: DoxX family protein [Thiobacillaceae bacterium]|nr:DoxX family protein [Thiobacillaceae bacterium]HNH88716.1 DoxX family protein [Thiobacillaceae bacterium]HNI07574.1 DoxX family protein [Thiobacillaceae bacterium]